MVKKVTEIGLSVSLEVRSEPKSPAIDSAAAKGTNPAFEAAVNYLERRVSRGKLLRDDNGVLRELSKEHARKLRNVGSGDTQQLHLSTTPVELHAGKGAKASDKTGNQQPVADTSVKVNKGKAASNPLKKVGRRLRRSKALKTIRKALRSSQTSQGVLGTTAATNAFGVLGKLAKPAQAVAAGEVLDAGTSVAGTEFYAIGLVASGARYDATRKEKEKTIRVLVENHELARRHVENPDEANAQTAAAYRRFIAASRKVVHRNKSGWIKDASDATLSQHQIGAQVSRYTLNTASSITNMASTFSAVSTTPASSILGIGVGIADAVGGSVALEAGRRKTQKLRGKLASLESWRYQYKNAEPDLPVAGIYEACNKEVRRQERLAQWAKRSAKIQIAKASSNIALGVAGTVLGALALATVATAAVATAGIAVAVASGCVAAAYLGYAATRAHRNARTGRHARRRQKEAQALIATHSTAELRALMKRSDPQARKATAITVERGGFMGMGKRQLRVTTVDAGRNAYVGLHLMACELAEVIDRCQRSGRKGVISDYLRLRDMTSCPVGEISAEAGAVIRLLQGTGMSPSDIQTLCDAASGMQGDQRLCYLKQELASSLGIPFKVQSEGREKPLTPFAWLGRINDLMADPEFEATARSANRADKQAAAAKLFEGVDFYGFAKAMNDPRLPQGASGSPAKVARELLMAETARRRNLLMNEAFSENDLKRVCGSIPGMDDNAVAAIFGFMNEHWKLLKAGSVEREAAAFDKAWMPAWKAAEAAGNLPDPGEYPWVALVSDAVRAAEGFSFRQ